MLQFKNLTDEYVLKSLLRDFEEHNELNNQILERSDDVTFRKIIESSINWNNERIDEINDMLRHVNRFGRLEVDYYNVD